VRRVAVRRFDGGVDERGLAQIQAGGPFEGLRAGAGDAQREGLLRDVLGSGPGPKARTATPWI
jgi:hypothetical protein